MRRLLAVGALAWDRVLRLSGPLAAGQRLSASPLEGASAEDRIPGRLGGGAANAAVAWARAGLSAHVAGRVPQDADGDRVLAALASVNVDVGSVIRSESGTVMTLILVDADGERTILNLPPKEENFRKTYASQLAQSAEAALARVSPNGVFLRAPIPLVVPQGVPVIAHWDGSSLLPPADVAVASASDIQQPDTERAFQIAAALSGPRLGWLLVTRGSDRITAIGSDRTIETPVEPGPVVDTTGAGDIFAAGLLDALSAGADMASALQHAATWGREAVALPTSAPTDAAPGTFVPYSG